MCAAGALLEYARATQGTAIAHVTSLAVEQERVWVRMDPATRRPNPGLGFAEDKADREGILRYFHTKAVGLPEEMLDGMRGTPMWEALLALTYTVRYDGLCMGPGSELPTELLGTIKTPVLAVSSTGTAMPFLPAAARAVAEGLPKGEYQQLEGGFHEVPAATLAPVIADFISRAGS